MLILGLGSNVGDRLSHLRRALSALGKVPQLKLKQVSPVYISDALLPDNAPIDWDMPYLNIAVRCESALEPLVLLQTLKNIEWTIGRKPEVRHWGPRILDIDILAWDDKVIESDLLTVPHASLPLRPFALWPLADVAPEWIFPLPGPNQGKTAAEMVEGWGSRFSGDVSLRTRQINQRIDTPALVGIVNATPDSFSDGGQFLATEHALLQINALINAGAEVIDLGGISTAPKSKAISPTEEWRRIEPILSGIMSSKAEWIIPTKISIDTYQASVAEKALAFNIDWINDQSGLDDPQMIDLIKNTTVDCTIMHHIKLPEERDKHIPRNLNPVTVVYDWLAKRLDSLEKQGIARERLIIDPGIGFGKLADQSWQLLKNIDAFASLNARILVGHSRKTFLSLQTSRPFAERDVETMVMALSLAKHPVHYLRVHNVDLCSRGLRVYAACEPLLSVTQ